MGGGFFAVTSWFFLGLDPGEFQERCQAVEFLQAEDGRRI